MKTQAVYQGNKREALDELRAELKEFSYDGLIALQEDLPKRVVVRGSWSGCVISYKRGEPGSVRRDRLGRSRNAFTRAWDNGWITDEEVAAVVAEEIARRNAALVPEQRSATVETPDTAEV